MGTSQFMKHSLYSYCCHPLLVCESKVRNGNSKRCLDLIDLEKVFKTDIDPHKRLRRADPKGECSDVGHLTVPTHPAESRPGPRPDDQHISLSLPHPVQGRPCFVFFSVFLSTMTSVVRILFLTSIVDHAYFAETSFTPIDCSQF